MLSLESNRQCPVDYVSFLELCIIFFFQAEDGIRDIGVTGVQTCALPISVAAAAGLLTDALFSFAAYRALPPWLLALDAGILAGVAPGPAPARGFLVAAPPARPAPVSPPAQAAPAPVVAEARWVPAECPVRAAPGA